MVEQQRTRTGFLGIVSPVVTYEKLFGSFQYVFEASS